MKKEIYFFNVNYKIYLECLWKNFYLEADLCNNNWIIKINKKEEKKFLISWDLLIIKNKKIKLNKIVKKCKQFYYQYKK